MSLRYLQKMKIIRNRYINERNIQPEHRNEIYELKMCHANKEKRENRNKGKNRTKKSGKYQNTRRK